MANYWIPVEDRNRAIVVIIQSRFLEQEALKGWGIFITITHLMNGSKMMETRLIS